MNNHGTDLIKTKASRRRAAGFLISTLIGLSASAPALDGQSAVMADAGAARRQFLAGAATSNITPPLGISLSGIISQKGRATHVHDELHARCLVLDDGRTRLAVVICDSTMISREIFDRAKQWVEEETGLPPSRILIAATHSHSTPRPLGLTLYRQPNGNGRLMGLQSATPEAEYEEFLARRIADGIRRAINNLAPARIGWGAGHKPEWVFNRRWLLAEGAIVVDPFGERNDRVQMNPRLAQVETVGPASVVDPEVFVLSVQHEDGRPLAVLANYGLHYIGNTGADVVSADYFGAFADRLGELLDADGQDPPFVGIMSNGTSGDVNGKDFRRPRAPEPPYAMIREVAGSVADEVLRVYQDIEHRAWVPLAMTETELELKVRRPDAERLEWAKATWEKRDRTKSLGRPEIYAREALALAAFPEKVSLKLQAIRIGDLGIAAVPCEVFAATGLQIKERSALPQTFTISLANGYNGYLPTPRDHELGGYETWPARSSYLEVQASEKIRDEILRLLSLVRHETEAASVTGVMPGFRSTIASP